MEPTPGTPTGGSNLASQRRWPMSCTEWVFGGEDLGQVADRLASAGYDGIEVNGEPHQVPASQVQRRLAASGLRVTSVCGRWWPERDLAHPSASVRAEAVDYLRRCLDFAGELGARLVIVVPTALDRVTPLADQDDQLAWAADSIARAVSAVPNDAPKVAVEALNRYETHLVTNLDQADALRRAVGSDVVTVMADAFHMNLEERSIAESIRAHAPHLSHVHLADSNRQAPGRGHTDFDAIITALAETGYQGGLTMEFRPVTDETLRSGLAYIGAICGGAHAATLR